MRERAVILLSGGIDSSTTLAIAKDGGYDCYALSFDYAQRHRRELESARALAHSLGVSKHLVIGFDLREIGGSALTSEMDVPKQQARLPDGKIVADDRKTGTTGTSYAYSGPGHERIPVTYVPARNTIFLSCALAWAEVLEASHIFIGANAVDYSGYPDCRPEYLKAFEDMANLATKISVEGKMRFRIHAPLLYLTKSEIIRQGTALGVDFGQTWSCYDPQPDGRPCGSCDSCLFRAKGFEAAGLPDPLLR